MAKECSYILVSVTLRMKSIPSLGNRAVSKLHLLIKNKKLTRNCCSCKLCANRGLKAAMVLLRKKQWVHLCGTGPSTVVGMFSMKHRGALLWAQLEENWAPWEHCKWPQGYEWPTQHAEGQETDGRCQESPTQRHCCSKEDEKPPFPSIHPPSSSDLCQLLPKGRITVTLSSFAR